MIQTINMTTSQDPWALGHGIVQGKFQRKCRCCHVNGLNQTDQYNVGPRLSLELSLELTLAIGPRILRCCQVDGLNQTDQYKVDPRLK